MRREQQAQERDALALDHEQRKLAEEYARAGSRLSVARLDLDRLAREDARTRTQREENLKLVDEKDRARLDLEQALETSRANLTELQISAHAMAEEHAGLRADLAGKEERLRSEKAATVRLEAQLLQWNTRREELARELERLGAERARLLADNI